MTGQCVTKTNTSTGRERKQTKKKVACHPFPFKAPAPTENGPRKRVVQKKDVQKGSSKALGPVVRQSRGREKNVRPLHLYSYTVFPYIKRLGVWIFSRLGRNSSITKSFNSSIIVHICSHSPFSFLLFSTALGVD